MPPPPPPGPPPPPSLNVDPVQLGKKEADGRNLLLSSIRQGANLKKAVTNDRSAPVIDGKPPSSGGGDARSNGAPPGLGGLFAGGMPKLKSTGRNVEGAGAAPMMPPNRRLAAPSPPSGAPNDDNGAPIPSLFHSSITPQVPFHGSLRRPFPNDRGPAPQPPPASNKPNLSGPPGSQSATLPRRAGPPLPNKPPVQSNKPQLGPKPFVTGRPAPGRNAGNGPPALPSQPPNLRRPASLGEHDYRTGQYGRGMMQATSTPRLNGNPPTPPGAINPSRNFTVPSNLNQLPHNKQAAPPPPPVPPAVTSVRTMAPPPPQRITTAPKAPLNRPPPPPGRPPVLSGSLGHPPPPPPSSAPPPPPANCNVPALAVAPPPPPHRGPASPLPPSQARMMHAPTVPGAPPPPPVRNTSTRTGNYAPSNTADFETRFFTGFRSINELPLPEEFTNCQKSYPSKNANSQRRQPPPPPPPPTHLQVNLSNNMYMRHETKC